MGRIPTHRSRATEVAGTRCFKAPGALKPTQTQPVLHLQKEMRLIDSDHHHSKSKSPWHVQDLFFISHSLVRAVFQSLTSLVNVRPAFQSTFISKYTFQQFFRSWGGAVESREVWAMLQFRKGIKGH